MKQHMLWLNVTNGCELKYLVFFSYVNASTMIYGTSDDYYTVDFLRTPLMGTVYSSIFCSGEKDRFYET